MRNVRTKDNPEWSRGCEASSHALPVGVQRGKASLEFGDFLQNQTDSYHMFTLRSWNLGPHENLRMTVHSSVVHNRQIFEATNIILQWAMSK